MRKYRAEFFDEPKEASRIKLRILQKYLVPWSSKLGSVNRGKTIWVVDGFAGPGSYRDAVNTPGSPKLILERAQKVITEDRAYRIGCVFVEQEPKHYAALEALCAQYPKVDHIVLQGDFWQKIPSIIARTAGQPLFVIVDPFGIKGMDHALLARLANSSRQCDLVVTFVARAVPRLESQYPDFVELAIGPRLLSDRSPADTFSRNMTDAAAFLAGGQFSIRQSFDAANAYELIVFSRSRDAYRLWNDFVTREWKELSRLKPQASGQQPFMSGFESALEEAGAEAEQHDAAMEILAWAREAKLNRFMRRTALDECAVHHFGDYHSSTLIQGITFLESCARIRAVGQTRNDSTTWQVLSLEPL